MLKRLAHRLAEPWRRKQLDREARDEMAHHLELEVERLVGSGLDRAEALRLARIELGDPETTREELREGRFGFGLEMLAKDTTLAFRTLRKRRVFALVCILTIGLGVGASTALFAVVNTVLLQPLPHPEAESLVRIYDTNLAKGVNRTGITTGNLVDWRQSATRLKGIAGHYTMGRTLTVGLESEVVLTTQVTEDFFSVLQTKAVLGRTFTPEETTAAVFNSAAAPVGTNPVAMLSFGLWKRRFGGDPAALGQSLMVDRKPFRIVGVLPEGFSMPGPDVQLFLPWSVSGTAPRDQHYVSSVARLAPGATIGQAEDELKGIATRLGRDYPTSNEGWSVSLVSLQDDVVGDSSRALYMLLAAVGLVLLVACANVALLSLARGLERVHEASIRLALGATRPKLVRQFLVEALLISSAGGALGAVFAYGGIALLKRAAADVPRLHEVVLDPRALLFACLASGAAALISGLPSAWRQSQAKPSPDLLGAPSRMAGASGRRNLRDGLVVAEVALAVVLLACASLLVRSYQQLRAVDPGFNAQGVLVAPIFLDMENYGSGGKSRIYYETLVERLRSLPGVVSAGGATALPASPVGPDFERPVWPDSAPSDEALKGQAWVRMITPNYFDTLGMRILDGRAFDRRDGPDGALSVILSEGLAKRLWPGGNAVGRRLVVDYSTAGTYPYDVVGVVNDVRFGGPRTAPRHEIYLPHAQRPYLVLNMAVRTKGDARYLAPAVRNVLHEIDPRKPAQGLFPLEDLLGNTYSRDRDAMIVLSAFAAVAVLLSLLGVHGMLTHHVRERRREIGIRMAIGADRRHVLGWVTGHGLKLSLSGLIIGGAIALVVGRGLSGLLFGVSAADPVALVVVLALPLIGFLVSLHPAWRATRIHPAEVLRAG
jgi:putative ABC transport system permease protein